MKVFWDAATGGFYDTRIHKAIPEGAVEITDAERTALLDGMSEGKIIIANEAGEPVLADPPVTAIDLDALKASLLARVDTDAEVIRAHYITAGSGQAMAYIEKARQAAAYLAAETPDDADYPLLVAEIGITGETVADVATAVDAAYRQWISIGGAIEAARLSAKRDIAAAETAEAAVAVLAATAWPAPAPAP